MPSDSTIAAIATPPGRGGVGVVRLSGPEAPAILAALAPGGPAQTPSHKMRLAELRAPSGELLDEALVVHMHAPKSYTGEDVVELQCHGGPVVLRRVLDAALEAGARPARPGEFTERAFLNGRLDLTQAEAVADLIEARSEAAHQLAIEHLQGRLGQAISGHLEALIEAMVLIESALDFSHEEHVYQIERDEVDARLARVGQDLQGLIDRFDRGRRQREGVRVVVAGATNAGKSTLFNALYGDERAIVTEVEGTTRDFLEEELELEGVAVRLVDTAGLRATTDRVEALGIERSRQWAERGDLVLWVIDHSRPIPATARELLEAHLGGERRVLIARNKQDLPPGLAPEDEALLARASDLVEVALGAAEPRGAEALLEALGEAVAELTAGEGVLLSRARHLSCVREALEATRRARQALDRGAELELLALDVREALDALGEIVGEVRAEDILARIFAEFCVGK